MVRRLLAGLVPTIALCLTLTPPAHADITLEQKLAALSGFTQPNAPSADGWVAAWQDRGAWAEYGFDWTTDLCSSSPDRPLGFDFRMSCRRHDFGYRNYKAVGLFDSNKPRVDDAFHFDMRRVCSGYSAIPRATCNSLAWTYYQAVREFGDLVVTTAQIEQIRLESERAAAA